jgi:hypothetical protein
MQHFLFPLVVVQIADGYRDMGFFVFGSMYVKVVCLFVCFPGVTTHCSCIFHSPVAGFSLLRFRGFLITHNDAPQSVGLLWTSDQSDAETST